VPRYLLVTNPVSGRGLDDAALAQVAGAFVAAGATLDVHKTRGPGEAGRIAARLPDGYDAIVAAGGDGTIGEVANGLAGKPVPLGVIPRGTANVLAKELGIPRDLPRAVEIILAGQVVKIDVGLADDRRFMLMASAGFDAKVVKLAHENRGRRFGYMSYVLPVLRALVDGDFPEMVAAVDGVEYPCRHAVVANVASYGGPFCVAEGASFDDGRLDVVLYLGAGRYNMVRYGVGALSCKLNVGDDVLRLSGERVSLRSSGDVPLQLDGDPAGSLPRDIRVLRRALAVLAPKS
jgi:YegS/Rv2252/BmrU family lipid kinase